MSEKTFKLIKNPLTGMKDILPKEEALRQYVSRVIRETYESYGFCQIDTPCMEALSNLNSKQGGDNEKLIFKILKRGEKLKLSEAGGENDLTDSGLRYDLTLPLVRFYSAHKDRLPSPFKAIQMGYVFRADRPQRGRYRQFMQCDIDIFGEGGTLAEMELLLAATRALGRLSFEDFVLRINDRRILKAMAAHSGFAEEDMDRVFISLDKRDKIGREGVRQDLIGEGFAEASIDSYLSLFDALEGREGTEGVALLQDLLKEILDPQITADLMEIMEGVEAGRRADFRLVFDPALVRGMSYYTGTIFEIQMPKYGGSCGGGGRYDRMVGKFTGQEVPACGFSIGFERIVMLLLEEGYVIPQERPKKCYLIEKGICGRELFAILQRAEEERKKGVDVLTVRMNKNRKFQKQQLEEEGYQDIEDVYLQK